MAFLRSWLQGSSPAALFALAVLVGVGGAVGAVLFHACISLGTWLFYGEVGSDFITHVTDLPWWLRLLIPAAGGLLVGLLFHVAKVREAEGEGVPEVMEALSAQRGTIRPIVAPVKIVAAALTLSSGGSAGREGPVIQIGSAIGSSIAQYFGLADRERSLLLACGAAAAIGGTFGAPFAGVVFTIEILRHRPTFLRTGLVTISALLGHLLVLLATGHQGLTFTVDQIVEFAWWPYGALAVVIGIVAALSALLFGLVLHAGAVVFGRLPVRTYLRPAIGGLAIGAIGLFVPYIHEPAAYPLMVDLFSLSAFPVTFLLGLLLIKMIATGITLGSGGVGGIFAPSLLLGTIVGSLVAAAAVAGGVVDSSAVALLALTGMAALFAAAAHAPVTAALITYEMTNESALIIPLLIACFVATFVARALRQDSLYESPHGENEERESSSQQEKGAVGADHAEGAQRHSGVGT